MWLFLPPLGQSLRTSAGGAGRTLNSAFWAARCLKIKSPNGRKDVTMGSFVSGTAPRGYKSPKLAFLGRIFLPSLRIWIYCYHMDEVITLLVDTRKGVPTYPSHKLALSVSFVGAQRIKTGDLHFTKGTDSSLLLSYNQCRPSSHTEQPAE